MKVKEIKEKAERSLSKWDSNIYFHHSDMTEDSYKDGYIEGYTECVAEQRQIDIERACKYLRMNLTSADYTSVFIERFRKYMEE